MVNNFAHIRTKARLTSLLLALLLGLGIGGIVLAGLMIAMKSVGEPIVALHYIIAAVAALGAVVVFLPVLVPSDRKLAKRLDEEHNLNEKVRTMLALRNEDGDFALLQRADTDEALANIKYKPWRKKPLVTTIVVLVVSVALLVTSLVIPVKTVQEEPETPLGVFDKALILAELSNIRSDVEKSLIADALKTKEVAELSSLIAFVETHDYLSEMKIEAVKTVIRIDTALDDENTAIPIGDQLVACTTPALKELGAELQKLNGAGAQTKVGQLCDGLKGGAIENVSFVADELLNAVEASGANPAAPLTALLKNLARSLGGCADSNPATIDAAFGTSKIEISTNLAQQNFNKMLTGTAVSRLCTLFGITVEDLTNAGADSDIEITPPATPPPPEEDTDDDIFENDQIGAGGIGTGDRVYGSNDMIYNPYTNEYVPYGQIFDEYNNKVLQMMQDGRIPPAFEEFTIEYFRSLSEYDPAE